MTPPKACARSLRSANRTGTTAGSESLAKGKPPDGCGQVRIRRQVSPAPWVSAGIAQQPGPQRQLLLKRQQGFGQREEDGFFLLEMHADQIAQLVQVLREGLSCGRSDTGGFWVWPSRRGTRFRPDRSVEAQPAKELAIPLPAALDPQPFPPQARPPSCGKILSRLKRGIDDGADLLVFLQEDLACGGH